MPNAIVMPMQMPNTRRIRQILAVIIVAASVALVAAVLVRQFRSNSSESASQPISPEIDMVITTLNFSEMRGNDKLWNLVADRADYHKSSGTTTLVGVRTEIYGSKTGGMVITSETGWYNEAEHLVKLQKNVHAVTKKGLVFDTEQLEYRTVPGVVVTDKPVKVVDGRLTLRAQGMNMSLNDEKVLFRGAVDAVIAGSHAKR